MSQGHGWVTPLPGGAKARCGGPSMCRQCAIELLHKKAAEADQTSRLAEESQEEAAGLAAEHESTARQAAEEIAEAARRAVERATVADLAAQSHLAAVRRSAENASRARQAAEAFEEAALALIRNTGSAGTSGVVT